MTFTLTPRTRLERDARWAPNHEKCKDAGGEQEGYGENTPEGVLKNMLKYLQQRQHGQNTDHKIHESEDPFVFAKKFPE